MTTSLVCGFLSVRQRPERESLQRVLQLFGSRVLEGKKGGLTKQNCEIIKPAL